MLSAIDPDPLQALIKTALGLGGIGVAIVVWFQLQLRVRRHGGGTLAAAATAVAVVAVMVGAVPNVLPFNLGILVAIMAMIAIYRPDLVIQATGGRRPEWRALREGRGLQLMVREQGGPVLARGNVEIRERIERLAELEGPGTMTYLLLLRETLLADPEAPGMDRKLATLAEADTVLRTALGTKPTWESDLEQRAAHRVSSSHLDEDDGSAPRHEVPGNGGTGPGIER